MPALPGHIDLGLVSTVRNDGSIQGGLGLGARDDKFDLQQPSKEFMERPLSPTHRWSPRWGRNCPRRCVPLVAAEPRDRRRFPCDLSNLGKQLREMMVTYGRDWLGSETSFAQIDMAVGKQ